MLIQYSTKCGRRGRLSRRYSVLARLAVDNSYCVVLIKPRTMLPRTMLIVLARSLQV